MSQCAYTSIAAWSSITRENWDSWQWQLRNAVRTLEELNSILACFTTLQVPTSSVVERIGRERFSFKVTPHMVLALKQALEGSITGAWNAFRRSFIPSELEADRLVDVTDGTDCIGEELPEANPVPAITNFYGNRVLFRVTTMCPAYCRYCFRRRMIGDGPGAWDEASITQGLAYVAGNSEVHEVIISGGDPLVLSDEHLAFVIGALNEIPHIRRIRIDTKALTMMPQRLTPRLIASLRGAKPVYMIVHFTHMYELTDETRAACAGLVDAGVPIRAHTPLLRGINDDEESLASLMEILVDCRVQPYYLIQFIPTKWTEHFRVSIRRGLELVRHLQKHCGGLATPTYIVYLPKAGGKVPVTPQYIKEHRSDGYVFESLDGRRILYPE